jgi:hypothetical protein
MSRRLKVLVPTAALALAACAAPAVAPAPATKAAEITAKAMYDHIAFLASDAMRGRDTPSPGLDSAAAYLVRHHQKLGLEPGGESGTFYQYYPYPLRRLSAEGTQLRFATPAGEQALTLGRDFVPGGGTTAPVSGALVYLGSGGDVAGEAGSLSGRVAVFSLPGSGMSRDFRMLRGQQQRIAERHGASAAIHIVDASWTDQVFGAAAATATRPARSYGAEVGYPSFLISNAAAQKLLGAAKLSLDALARTPAAAAKQPVPLAGLSAALAAPVESLDEAKAPNVVAILRGSDPALRDEYVVISAHMDHVGVGRADEKGDSIYNGADDNASGTSALAEIARAMAESGERPRRSVIFLHVSGEEKGLLGSRWYSDHPTVPLEKIVANINLDMIAYNAPDSIVVIGKDYSSLGETMNRLNAENPDLGLIAADDIWPEERFFFRSDHYNFARKEIPALFFFSGVHRCYHRPCDEPDFIDPAKAARVATLALYTIRDIANADERPTWVPAGLEEVRALTR